MKSNVEATAASLSLAPVQQSNRLQLEKYPSAASIKTGSGTAEERYWKSYRFPVLLKQSGAVTRCEFSPVAPFTIVATAGPGVALINPVTKEVNRSVSKFKTLAYSASYRSDGNLFVAGGMDPVVQVFDSHNPRTILRSFRGHKAAVQVARFSRELPQVLSGSDDKTLCLWDVEGGQAAPLRTFLGHSDYVRTAAPSLLSPHCWLSGGYDHTVRLWYARSEGGKALSLDHGHPVQDVLVFPGGTTVATAGGPCVKIWDLLGGGQLLQTLTNHQKAVTCLFMDSSRLRLMTGSIDRMIKVYDLHNSLTTEDGVCQYQVLHTIKYPAPILCAALSPDDQHLMVGMTDGILSVRSRPASAASAAPLSASHKQIALQFHVKGRHAIDQAHHRPGEHASLSDVADYTVGLSLSSAQRQRRIKPYERMMKKFQYYEALNAALATTDPTIVVSLIKELVRRRGLSIALAGRDEADLLPLLKFLARYIRHPRYADFLLTVFGLVLEIYSSILGQSVEMDSWFRKIQRKLHVELKFQKEILRLIGTLNIYVSASSSS